MADRLGPLRADGTGSRLDAVAGAGCRFTAAGVELAGTDGGTATLPWPEVHSVTVRVPVRYRWLRAAPDLVLSLLSSGVGDVRSRSLLVQVTGRWGAGPSVDLGRVGPYGWREAVAAEALLRALSERPGRLPALGDPGAAAALVAAAASVRPGRVARAVDAVLSAPRR